MTKKDFDKERDDLDRKKNFSDEHPDANRDPITGEPGSHPIGVAAGGTGGAVTGAAVGGAVGGPIGAAIGGVVGAIAGGAVGKIAAEAVNPTEEDRYWQENYPTRPYYKKGADYTEYEPAYRYGWESAANPQFSDKNFDEIESNLQSEWPSYRGTCRLEWIEVRDATRDAFDRVRTGTRQGTQEAFKDTRKTAEKFGTEARGTGNYLEEKSASFWEQVKGNWKQFKGAIKEKWNELTDDEIDQMEGRRERIVGKIQEKYGETRWKEADIERELQNIDRR
jgi:uncharacterized protein YjbJ (UPF0337 family)